MHNIEILSDFNPYIKIFLEENSKHNLISKNDEKFLREKHIYDSLGIKLFFEKYGLMPATLLDIGCGGGFPCVPIAIEFPEIKVTGLDSIRKKINSVRIIKEVLKLDNLDLVCERAENFSERKFDIAVSRAVADLSKIASYALPLVKDGGYFVAYKSKKVQEEVSAAEPILNKLGGKITDIIEYKLPLDEIYERNLVCIKKTADKKQ